ncbi:MAG: UbiA family prenyltransferase, partial [Flavobacteriales bacterium]
MGFGFTGYFLNDWADIPYDQKAGKTNLVVGVTKIARPLILIGLLAVTLFPWFVYFHVDKLSIALIALQLVLQFSYPIPPIRLKNYPIPAIVTDALYAFVIPCLLAWHTFDTTLGLSDYQFHDAHLYVLALWMLVIGVRQILNHHVADQHNDSKTGTPNITNSFGSPKILRFNKALFLIEALASIAFFSSLASIHLLLSVLIIALLLLAFLGHLSSRKPFVRLSFSGTRLDKVNAFYVGLISLIFLTAQQWSYALIGVLFVLFFSDLVTHPLVGVLSRKGTKLLVVLLRAPYNLASLSFNWALYYFRKWVLGWSEERNWGEHYSKRLDDLALEERKNRGIVAVFNQNSGKYTETFVNGHLMNLPFHVVPFHGW